jgi:uncharacterized protein with PIN domain
MDKVFIKFLDEMNMILPAKKRGISSITLQGRRTIKDLIESLGVPHTEVGYVTVNNLDADLNYILRPGDKITVYPVLLKSTSRKDKSKQRLKFLCDVHLWKLARHLRILGFDVGFDKDLDDRRLADISASEHRILLTRDRRLLMRKKITSGLLIKHLDIDKQISEVMNRFDLKNQCNPFSRCPQCNGKLKKINPKDRTTQDIMAQIPAKVRQWCRQFNRCQTCGKLYWKGTHYDKLILKIQRYIENST